MTPTPESVRKAEKLATEWFHQCGFPCDGNDLPHLEQLIATALDEASRPAKELAAERREHPRCDDCGTELTDCGPLTIDGPSADCPLCKCRQSLAAEREAVRVLGEEARHWWRMFESLRDIPIDLWHKESGKDMRVTVGTTIAAQPAITAHFKTRANPIASAAIEGATK